MNNRSAPRPVWCGSCDRVTRQLEADDGRPYRCPTCHPARAQAMTKTEPGEAHMDTWWASGARRALEQLAAQGRPFTASDVRAVLDSEPDEPNQWGSLFRQAHKDGLIHPVGVAQSSVASRRSGMNLSWVGVQP